MPKRKNLLRNAMISVLGAAAVLALAWAWMPAPVLVEVATLQRGPVVLEVVEDGRVEVIDRYTVSAPLPGILARPTLRPGDAVEANQTLTRILPGEAPLLDTRTRSEAAARLSAARDARTIAQSNLRAAELAATQASHDLDRARRLGAIVTREELERIESDARLRTEQATSARFAVDVANHEAEMAAAVLGRKRARGTDDVFEVGAPASGRVLRVFQESAGPVAAGTPLLEVGDPRALEVVIDVLSPDAVRIREGAPAWVEGWGGQTPLRARVRRVEPAAFTRISALGVEEQRVDVILAFEAPPPEPLGDAYRVDARIEIDRRDGALVVPESAVFRSGDGPAVFRFQSGRVLRTAVSLGLRNGVDAEVLDGLVEGDQVVLHPGDALDDGVRARLLD